MTALPHAPLVSSADAPSSDPQLAALLARLDGQAPLAQRHLWLIALLAWVRGGQASAPESVPDAVARVGRFMDAVEAQPAVQARLQAWWLAMVDTVDITTLLADFGFAARNAMVSELATRLRYKLLPSSPETLDAGELFALALPTAMDAQWLAALQEDSLQRLVRLLAGPDSQGLAWKTALLDAMTYCAGQILSTGFAPDLRLRMSEEARQAQPFHALIRDVESLRVEVLHGLRTPERLNEAAARLCGRLEACRAAVQSVYPHFEDNGISVGLVFRMRQLRERILRVRALLDCVLSPTPAQSAAQLLAQLVKVGRDRRSLRALVAANSSLLAAKVAERSAETGEHYITRTRAEYRAMVGMAAGGGAVMAFTTLIKFGLYALALSAFWGGLAAGLNYALSFVLIQLLHFTVATKQPAMTAPAMAAQLKELDKPGAVDAFVDKVSCLVRSQVAAVLGNVLVVFPAALALSLLWRVLWGQPPLSEDKALHVLDGLHLLGPSLLFAAYTGVLLFASSILAGWTENAFVLLRLDSALRYHPRIVGALGAERAARWARFWRAHISGLAANVSLGFMLAFTPAIAGFFGLGLDARHVTLSSGQIGVASATLGLEALHTGAFWWALAMVPFNGALNVGVSFYLAFHLAARAQNISGVDRQRIYTAIRARLRSAPWSFFWPESVFKVFS